MIADIALAPVAVAAFTVTLTGLQVTGTPTYEQWEQKGNEIWSDKQAAQWRTGDWLVWGEQAFGEDAAQAIDENRYTFHSLQNIVTVCKAFPQDERRPNVSFSNHSECASLQGEDRKLAMDNLESGIWNRTQVREYKRELKGAPASGKLEIVPHKIIGMRGENGKTTITIECDVPFGTIELVKAYRKVAA